jgi:hypothetical protein
VWCLDTEIASVRQINLRRNETESVLKACKKKTLATFGIGCPVEPSSESIETSIGTTGILYFISLTQNKRELTFKKSYELFVRTGLKHVNKP